LILDTLGYSSGLFAGAEGPFVSYLATAGARDGLDQFIADEKSQQLSINVHIAAGAGVVCAQADLLPGHTDHPISGHPLAHPVIAAAILAAGLRLRGLCQHRACGESFGRVAISNP